MMQNIANENAAPNRGASEDAHEPKRVWTPETVVGYVHGLLGVLGFWSHVEVDEWMEHFAGDELLALYRVVEDRIAAGVVDEEDALTAWTDLMRLRAALQQQKAATWGRATRGLAS